MKKLHETAELEVDSWLAQFIDGSSGRCVRSSGDSSSRPSFLVLNPKFGLIAIEVGAMTDSAEQTRVKLNLKVNALEKQLSKLAGLPLIRISIIHKPKNFFEKINDGAFVVEKNQVNKIVWDKELSSKNLDVSLLKKATETLWPEFSFAKPTYSGTRDKKKLKSDWIRLQLDAEQTAVATRGIKDVLIVSGPPGSGKTLVLCARAKWFAREFPNKRCLFVVHNSMLEKFIIAQNPDWPSNVELVTMRALLKKNGHDALVKLLNNFELEPDEHDRRASSLITRILDNDFEASFDALLVDEWQDFRMPYIQYLLASLKKNSLGAMFAGDVAQAIYTSGVSLTSIRGRQIDEVKLDFSYRCTRQILDVAGALDDDYKIFNTENARDGEPVSLVRAEYWATQAEGISWEVSKLLSDDNRHPSEIAVLCTTKAGANHVAQAFTRAGIEFELLTKFWENASPSNKKINIMTIHGAKGFGFNVVFLMGFETLKDRDGRHERDMWGRVGFVGVTRAQDLLFIFYGNETKFIDNLSKCVNETLTQRIYPGDYEI